MCISEKTLSLAHSISLSSLERESTYPLINSHSLYQLQRYATNTPFPSSSASYDDIRVTALSSPYFPTETSPPQALFLQPPILW